jgi:hypothetical protein
MRQRQRLSEPADETDCDELLSLSYADFVCHSGWRRVLFYITGRYE